MYRLGWTIWRDYLMRKTLFAATFALLGLAAAVPAEAMPFPPLGEEAPSAITLTAGGCGIGFHRGPWGGCRPNGYYGYRPYAYGYRPYAYGYGYRPYGFYGRRCWWRGGVRVCA
jgi:hypothetical protein